MTVYPYDTEYRIFLKHEIHVQYKQFCENKLLHWEYLDEAVT